MPAARPREVPTVDEVARRVEVLERQETVYRLTIAALEKADSATATAVDKLGLAINDPESGLIVQLRLFRIEVANDRAAFRAWVRGATAVLGLIIGAATIAAPWVRVAIETALHIPATP